MQPRYARSCLPRLHWPALAELVAGPGTPAAAAGSPKQGSTNVARDTNVAREHRTTRTGQTPNTNTHDNRFQGRDYDQAN
jgi:hypothetical protein